MRSSTSGSSAALSITVVPRARVAARIAFSVPITDTVGKRDVRAAQSVLRRRGEVVAVAVDDRGAHRLQGRHVEVDGPSTDPIPAGVRQDDAAEPRQHRAEQDEAGAHLQRGLERHERPLRALGLEDEGVAVGPADVDADVAHHLAQDRHVADARNVVERDRFLGQHGGGHLLQHRVLGAGDANLAVQRHAAGDHELLHGPMKSRGSLAYDTAVYDDGRSPRVTRHPGQASFHSWTPWWCPSHSPTRPPEWRDGRYGCIPASNGVGIAVADRHPLLARPRVEVVGRAEPIRAGEVDGLAVRRARRQADRSGLAHDLDPHRQLRHPGAAVIAGQHGRSGGTHRLSPGSGRRRPRGGSG